VHRLDEGLRCSRAGVVVVSPASMSRPWVRQEYAALLEAAVGAGHPLVPVVIGDAEMPPLLATRLWVDLRGRDPDAYAAEVRRLAAALRGLRPGPPPRPPAPPPPPRT
jgi:hypothetical protein